MRARVYVGIVAVWLATRVWAVASVQLKPEILNDVHLYEVWAAYLRAQTFPIDDVTWQYPPGAAPIFVGASLLPRDFRFGFTSLCLLIDLAILVALFIAHRRTAEARSAGLWLWAAAGVVVGPIMFVRFDLVPTLFAVLAVLLAARPISSGIAAGIGFVVKLWPALMVLSLRRTSLVRALIAFVATAAIVVGWFALTYDGAWTFLANQRDRGLQIESVGALPYEILAFLGGEMRSQLQYGSVQVTMPGAEAIGSVVTIAGVAVVLLIAWWRLRGRLEQTPAGDVGLALVLVSVAGSRVYSPQFNTWIVGLAAAALIAPRTRMRRVAMIVVGVCLITQVVYPWFPWLLSEGNRWGIAAQALRIAGLLAATIIAVLRLREPSLTAVPTAQRPTQPPH